jgi:transcription initiation factor TFIIB
MIVDNNSKLVLQRTSADTCISTGGLHGPLVTDSSRGEILCSRCGMVIMDKVEDTTEQRSHTLEDYNNNTRTGIASALSIHDKGLSTIIGNTDRDASGNFISSYMKSTFNRLRTWDSRSRTNSQERNLRIAFVVLATAKSKLDISDVIIERAAYLYRKAINKNITRGRTITGMILSALYVSCREANMPRTLQEIADVGNISFKNLSRHYRVLVKALDLQVGSFDPSEFVSKIGTTVGLSEKAKRDALGILHDVQKIGISAGKNPVSLAATAIFLSAVLNKEKITQDKISDVAGVSTVTIRNNAKILRKKLGMDQ